MKFLFFFLTIFCGSASASINDIDQFIEKSSCEHRLEMINFCSQLGFKSYRWVNKKYNAVEFRQNFKQKTLEEKQEKYFATDDGFVKMRFLFLIILLVFGLPFTKWSESVSIEMRLTRKIIFFWKWLVCVSGTIFCLYIGLSILIEITDVKKEKETYNEETFHGSVFNTCYTYVPRAYSVSCKREWNRNKSRWNSCSFCKSFKDRRN